jgi:hypothetical protein
MERPNNQLLRLTLPALRKISFQSHQFGRLLINLFLRQQNFKLDRRVLYLPASFSRETRHPESRQDARRHTGTFRGDLS